jgi:hypothetical protein
MMIDPRTINNHFGNTVFQGKITRNNIGQVARII